MVRGMCGHMRTIQQIGRRLLSNGPLLRPVYNSYIFAWRHAYWKKLTVMRDFYGQFVHKGSRVFDIGANVGERTEIFLDLGASVVAVEPVPSCLARLREIWSERLSVVPCAVADKEGTAKLHVSNISYFSTASDQWLAIAEQTDRFKEAAWDQELTVPTVTIDTLIRDYGAPDFIKIDVEGFEKEVLSGMSTLPCPVIFEFNSEWMDATISCLSKPCFSGNVEYNFSVGTDRLVLDHWVGRDELLKNLRGVAGDIVVRPSLDRA
jgi:FkbM family methyltransferase